MRYGSVCSGIEAATVAWEPLGWQPAFFSEIEKFPRAVLRHHYPDVPCHGDFTTIKGDEYGAIDLLVGGTPCQSFSVAGLRGGLGDDRGNLALEFLRLIARTSPHWVVWENVPGVLSSTSHDAPDPCEPPPPLDVECDGEEVETYDEYDSEELHAFNCFLAGLSELGYGFSYRVLDAQHFGVPQRRRRVFVIGYLGDWRPAAAVLFERESLRGDITPRREARENVAPTISARTKGGGGLGTDFDCDGGLIPVMKLGHTKSNGCGIDEGQAYTLEATNSCNQAVLPINTQIATRHNALGERTGLGIGDAGDPAFTLSSAHHHAIASFKAGQGSSAGGIGYDENLAPTLGAAESGSNRTPSLMQGMSVRRLTPRECERLQGFPDDFTLIPYRGKMAADGPRYKALGNSMAVPVMRWIGDRINSVENLLTDRTGCGISGSSNNKEPLK